MRIRKRCLSALTALLVCSLFRGAAALPKRAVLETGGRQVLCSAVEDMYNVTLSRGGTRAAGTARTGDMLSDGRVLIVSGDLTTDGQVNISDLVLAVRALRGEDVGALSVDAGDLNRSGRVDIADLARLASMLPAAASPPLAEIPPFPLDYFQAQVSAMIGEMNAYRASRGLPPLQERTDMDTFCQIRAEEQLLNADWGLSHLRPNGGGFWEGALYPPSGEVLAHCMVYPESGTYMDAAKWAVDQWIHSPSHEEIMTNGTAKYAGGGIAYGKGPDGRWWWKACLHIGHA